MLSLLPQAMKPRAAPDEARPASTWIERYAIPVTISVMEAQPIALVIALLTFVVARNVAAAPIGTTGITLINLILLWWAMFVESRISHSQVGRRLAWLHVIGWLVVLGLTMGIYFLPATLTWQRIPASLLLTILVTWLWRRNMHRTQTGFEYEQFSTAFKVSFGVMLGILLIVIAFPQLQALRADLTASLPLFFLSGLVTLSLVRLGAIRHVRRSSDDSLVDPTRSWLLGLSLFGVILVALVFLVESVFSFSVLEMGVSALAPVWNALGVAVSWILYALIIVVFTPLYYLFSFVFGLLAHNGNKQQQQQQAGFQSPFQQKISPHTLSPEVIAIGRWVFLVIALIVIFFVVRASLMRWFTRANDQGVEEIREGLDASSLLSERWRAWWNRHHRTIHHALEPLDPASARARYREVLQAVAASRGGLARQPAETPAEYEARLLAYLESEMQSVSNLAQNGSDAMNTAILKELTHAYVMERYGGKRIDQPERVYLQTWVPRLIGRLTGKAMQDAPKRRTQSRIP
ncbi:MAG TPA: DUF4129 domain-containing protein [Ktedonobacteraceae bacterium]|nr:DUF4129 domain-containing protein [Ktedonobacteraceae bacterium]